MTNGVSVSPGVWTPPIILCGEKKRASFCVRPASSPGTTGFISISAYGPGTGQPRHHGIHQHLGLRTWNGTAPAPRGSSASRRTDLERDSPGTTGFISISAYAPGTGQPRHHGIHQHLGVRTWNGAGQPERLVASHTQITDQQPTTQNLFIYVSAIS